MVLVGTLFYDTQVSLPPFETIRFNLVDLWPQHVVLKDLSQEEQPSMLLVESDPEFAETSK